ncbi:hypothetical protein [Azospirillum picis]|uniref:Uncharacterized protein n=1 Tax=Azospirillum picis TaxID=488438 RepID=A0ABU0MHG5_9PROT|nr:hypothetical protein [Azospirillum picis]MBP2299079.1 hypothetical protein [Azospirillum picis]MDQ0532679.1 hypothetical protein [Azospirillum picis]
MFQRSRDLRCQTALLGFDAAAIPVEAFAAGAFVAHSATGIAVDGRDLSLCAGPRDPAGRVPAIGQAAPEMGFHMGLDITSSTAGAAIGLKLAQSRMDFGVKALSANADQQQETIAALIDPAGGAGGSVTPTRGQGLNIVV